MMMLDFLCRLEANSTSGAQTSGSGPLAGVAGSIWSFGRPGSLGRLGSGGVDSVQVRQSRHVIKVVRDGSMSFHGPGSLCITTRSFACTVVRRAVLSLHVATARQPDRATPAAPGYHIQLHSHSSPERAIHQVQEA